jgi:hypothetical protein
VALFRLVELSAGRITIDGVDISTVGLSHLRRGMAAIQQEAILFSGTLRSNLDPLDQVRMIKLGLRTGYSSLEVSALLTRSTRCRLEGAGRWGLTSPFPLHPGQPRKASSGPAPPLKNLNTLHSKAPFPPCPTSPCFLGERRQAS